MSERHVDIFLIGQPPVQYIVWSDDKKEIAAYCLITASIKQKQCKVQLVGITQPETIKEAAIWHIFTKPAYRRQGFAKVLLDSLKVTFDRIYTQALVPESRKLLLDNGFKRVHESEAENLFEWVREK